MSIKYCSGSSIVFLVKCQLLIKMGEKRTVAVI